MVKSNPTLTARWALKGQQPEISTYYGYKSRSIFGTVNILNGSLIYHFANRQNQREFVGHLRQILQKYPDKIIWLYADGALWHKGKKVKKYLKDHPCLKIKFLPPHSPQLNPVERFWKLMRRYVTHNQFYRLIAFFNKALSKFFSSISRQPKKIYPICCNI